MNRGNKRGGGGGRFNQWRNRDNNNVDQDGDVRISGNNSEIKRRVTFKAQHHDGGGGFKNNNRGGMGNRGGNRGKRGMMRSKAFQKHLDDLEMGDSETVTWNSNFRKGRPGSPPPRLGNRRLDRSSSGWYLITIPHGHKYDREFIIRSLLEQIQPQTFIPYYYRVETALASFWVDDFAIAQRLLEANRKIDLPNGYKMNVFARAGTPIVNLDENMKERMKNAMVKRYNPSLKALDLSQFYADPDLLESFCSISRPTVLLAALDIMEKNIPDLEALNLSNNRLSYLDHFKNVADRFAKLRIIYLTNNRVTNLSALDYMKNVKLVELDLRGNPAKDRYKDQNVYVQDVRKRFPKLEKLDGVDLPKSIGFDLDDPKHLPPAKASFLINPSGADIVRQFLEQYFVIYDSNDRQPLLDAYHEQAQMSLTISYSQLQSNAQRLSAYLPFNRNIFRAKDSDQRCRHLKYGKLAIVGLLSELPASQHDPQSFGVDLTLFTDKLIHLTVSGMFKERKQGGSTELVRSFQRSLVIVPNGSGFCIRNEVLHVSLATPSQEKSIFLPRLPDTPAATIATFVSPPQGSAQSNDQLHQQMVVAMSQQSGMNIEWSRKCLEETNWDYQRAGLIFTELQKQNKIPPQAFVK